MPDIADIPLPSVEGGSSTTIASSTPGLDGQNSRESTPHVILTPPSSSSAQSSVEPSQDSASEGSPRATLASSPGNHNLSRAMQEVQLSSPDRMNMAGISSALNAAVQDSERQPSSPNLEELSPGRRASTPRRSPRPRRLSSQENRHDVGSEELPRDAFNERSFQNAFQDTRRLVSGISTELGSGFLHAEPDSTMHRLHSESRDLAGFRCPSTRTVGFVGDSGTGKSSLINSLLDSENLARTSDAGRACTCVATEYHFHGDRQLTIEVELFGMDYCAEQLEDLLQAYRLFEENQDEMEPDAREHFQTKSILAEDTFRSMFGGRLDDEAFLLEDPEEEVLETLKTWAEEILESQSTAPRTGLTLQECSALLMELSSERASSDEPAIWPYIRTIKVFLNAHILSKGLILVDLPGLRDLNSARRNVTERFLRKCDEIFVVCNIGRAATDEGVQSVFELADSAGLSRVGIICTRSDDVNPVEALRDHNNARARRIRTLKEAFDVEARACNDLEEELRDYPENAELTIDERDYRSQLITEHFEAGTRRKSANFLLTKYLVEIRNEDVSRDLKETYDDIAPNGGVTVFCVSNRFYWDYRDRERNEALPYLVLSGIIDVRRHCISIVSTSQHRAAIQYMRHSVPAHFAQIQLWVQSGAGNADLEARQRLCSALDTLEAWLRRDLTSHSSDVNTIARVLKQSFDAEVYQRRRIEDWSETAQEAGFDWSTWHHASYAAFCRNYGNHYTAKVKSRNWNEEAINGMVRDMRRPWQVLFTTLQEQQEATVLLFESLADRAASHLEAHLDDRREAVVPLTQALESQLSLAIDSAEQAFQDIERNLSSLRVDALTGIRTSFIGQAMESSYRECCRESGTGSHARRKGIINGRLEQEDLFSQLMRDCRRRFRQLADSVQEAVQTSTSSHVDVIRGVLDIVRRENVAREGERDVEFRNRVDEALRDAQARHERTLQALPA